MESKFLVFVKLETTGFADHTSRSDSPTQPHIVSLSALLVDSETRETVAFLNEIVKPDGWVIPEETVAIHGITQDQALSVGIPESELVKKFELMVSENTVICHSAAFTAKILRTAAKRYLGEETAQQWKERGYVCTARETKDIVKVPAAKAGTYKQPTLDQAHQFFKGVGFTDSVAVGGSANAVKDIYFAHQDLLR